MMGELISFVIPCYNSTDTIGAVVDEIAEMMETSMCEYDFEVILINDSSPDGTTYEAIKKLAETRRFVKGINLARNFGQPSAVMAGMNHAKGNYIVCGDDDGQTPFSEFPKLFEKITEGYDAVEARYEQHSRRSLFRKFGTVMNESMATWLINKPKGIVLTTYWVVRRFVADEMIRYSNAYPYLGGLMMRATQNVCNVNFAQRDRLKGRSGYSISKMLSLWLNGFTSFSVKPLRLTSVLGVLFSIVGLAAGVITVIRKILNPDVLAGYSSILSVILVLFGLQFLIMGMLGEYIGRSYLSLNNAPQFVIKETINIEE